MGAYFLAQWRVYGMQPSSPQIRDIRDVNGKPIGELIMQAGVEGKVNEVTYKWPRPGSEEPVAKTSLVTRIGDQTCGVGCYAQ
jgi:hypothetical protein